ncbi:hypothetical protein NDU88_000239 [Pleurodeles waltl]|uniref:Uncharacterized protein n=1 Tax=Pleurodeles waltl TaxID=8319 RepID=A0AAV7KNF6_PLEWA|nr:hypothetical protein NDU88_000239 [Pleurodeles waltl]
MPLQSLSVPAFRQVNEGLARLHAPPGWRPASNAPADFSFRLPPVFRQPVYSSLGVPGQLAAQLLSTTPPLVSAGAGPRQSQQYRARKPGPPASTHPKALRAPPPLIWCGRQPQRRLSPGPDSWAARHLSRALRWARACRSMQLPRPQIPRARSLLQRGPGGHNQGLRQSGTPQRRSAPVIGAPLAARTLDAAG